MAHCYMRQYIIGEHYQQITHIILTFKWKNLVLGIPYYTEPLVLQVILLCENLPN